MALQPPQPKKAVIYCRVSTREQVEEGNSLASQERHCREYAKINGYEIAAIFIEEGESAKTIQRTQLKKLMAFCSLKKNAVSVVIAYKIDRISRNTEDYSYIKILLRRNGVEIKSTSENFDSTPAGRFMENILSNVGQFDNDVRAERCSGGMKDAVREGRYVWLAPYGYSNIRVNGKATIAPNENAIFIQKAFKRIALQRYPASEIRKELIAEGMFTKSGKPISKSHFYSILRDELYTGWINKFSERNKGRFEPIISDELFAFVQKVLSGKRHIKTRFSKQHPDFPLRGLFKHTSGKKLTGGWAQGRTKKYAYYMFHHTDINIRKEVLETVFINWLNTFFKIDIDYFDKLMQFTRQHSVEKLQRENVTLNAIPEKIEALKAKQLLLFEKNTEGIISNDFAKEQISLLDAEIYELNQKLKDKPINSINEIELLRTTRKILLSPGEVWERSNNNIKQRLQWFYFPHGILFDKTESRTTKICSITKLKKVISPFESFVVDHSNSKLNTQSWQILKLPPREEIDLNTPEHFESIKEDLIALNNIINPPPIDEYEQVFAA